MYMLDLEQLVQWNQLLTMNKRVFEGTPDPVDDSSTQLYLQQLLNQAPPPNVQPTEKQLKQVVPFAYNDLSTNTYLARKRKRSEKVPEEFIMSNPNPLSAVGIHPNQIQPTFNAPYIYHSNVNDVSHSNPVSNFYEPTSTQISSTEAYHPVLDQQPISHITSSKRRKVWSRQDSIALLKCARLMLHCELKEITQVIGSYLGNDHSGRAAEKKLKRLINFDTWRVSNKQEIKASIDAKLVELGADLETTDPKLVEAVSKLRPNLW